MPLCGSPLVNYFEPYIKYEKFGTLLEVTRMLYVYSIPHKGLDLLVLDVRGFSVVIVVNMLCIPNAM